jgi:EmrB/QacA subfamily drug resistance transporter
MSVHEAGETIQAAPTAPPIEASAATGRNLVLATWVIAVARFIVVLDGTIMIVAIPSIQRSLQMSASSLNWVITAYSLTFGGLMLVAGRLGDVLGRKKVFRFGLVLFGVASLLGGLAPDGPTLIVFRGVQGIGAAIATPGALSLLVSTFPEGRARSKALGLYGAMTGMASVLGLLLGGLLTTYASWRWVLLVNVPIIIGLLLGVRVLTEGQLQRVRVDLPGAITATLGVGSLVFAVNRVGEHGWSDSIVIGLLALALVLLLAFVIIQRTSRLPMIPRGVLNERGRAGANIVTAIMSAGMFATYYFLTLYMQQVLEYSALRTGLMYLPFAVGFGIAAGGLGPQLLNRASERVALSVGLVLAAAGTAWFSLLTAQPHLFAVLIPASVLTGTGLGVTAVVATSIGVRGIDNTEAGIGSALLTAGNQVGGALGLAVLATIAATTASHAAQGTAIADALTRGYTVAFTIAAGLYLASLIITLLTVKPLLQRQPSGRPDGTTRGTQPGHRPAPARIAAVLGGGLRPTASPQIRTASSPTGQDPRRPERRLELNHARESDLPHNPRCTQELT